MIGSLLFFFYLAMCFTGLLGLLLIAALMRHGARQGEALLRAGRWFMLADLLVGLFYFYTYYREMVLGQFHDGLVLRSIDALQFYVIALAWLGFIYTAAGGPSRADAKAGQAPDAADGPAVQPEFRQASFRVFPVLMVLSLAAYLVLLDGYYRPVFDRTFVLITMTEAVLNCSVILFTLLYVRYCFDRLTDLFERRFILTVSILLNFNNVWNSAAVVITLRRQLGEDILSSYMYALTAAALLAVNLLTILFFYRRDFSPLFYAGEGQPLEEAKQGPLTEGEAMDRIAAAYGLTQREREVMELAYQGMTNPQIAEELVISRHTVKRHMHNLFAKLQVQARMELVHLVGEYQKR